MPTVADLFTQAWQHQQAHEYRRAEQLFRQILQVDPKHPDAWCYLGVSCQAQGKAAEAEGHLQRAIQLAPSHPSARSFLGAVLFQQGRLADAVASFEEALHNEPGNSEIQNNLSLVHYALAMAFAKQNRHDAEIQQLQKALQLRPEYVEAHNSLGHAFLAQGRVAEAIDHWQHSLQLQLHQADVHNNLANALQSQGHLGQAVDHYRQALTLAPNFAAAHNNLGNVLRNQGKLQEATAHWHTALSLNHAYAEPHYNLAKEFQKHGQLDQALAHYDQALTLKPDYADAHWNRSLLLLLRGDFEHGWPEYEWRWTQRDFRRRSFSQPCWDGSPLQGRTILLHAEQGLGDTLQFIRYSRVLKEQGSKVVVECQFSLGRLLARAGGIDQLALQGEPLPPFDVHAPLLSLPGIVHTDLANFPAGIPYLRADPILVERWRRELQPERGFTVGIVWQGRPSYGGDRERSVPLACFAPLANLKGVRLVSLQKGAGTEQLLNSCQLSAIGHQPEASVELMAVHELGPGLDETAGAFMDTAAVMVNLDLVICSDSAVAHLAGALGVPVWVALHLVPDWRWLLEREDSPWYPTMRLFRQTQYGQWQDVFERMHYQLRLNAESAENAERRKAASTF